MAVVIGLVVGFAAGWGAHMLFGPAVQRMIRSEKPSTPGPIHTAKAETGWEVQQEGRTQPIAEFPTKAEAQAAGRDLAKEAGTITSFTRPTARSAKSGTTGTSRTA